MDIPSISDSDIHSRIRSLVGDDDVKILDCEKKSSLVTEEVLLINGERVKLPAATAEKIKRALKSGDSVPAELLNDILRRTGIETAPVQLETQTTTKSATKTSEISTLTDSAGNLINEKVNEFEEEDEIESANVEVWERDEGADNSSMERERDRLMDFYKNMVKPEIWKSGKHPKHVVIEESREERDREITKSLSRNRSVQKPELKPRSTSEVTLPGKMPPVMQSVKIRPHIPPKPKYVGSLRTDEGLQVPIRVVYETFI